MQLSLNNISMRFGARILFEDVNTTFISGRRYAITGPNGAGKSTLMKILTGEIEPEKGSVTRPKRMGVLSQNQFAFDAYRVMDTVIMGNSRLWQALQERESLHWLQNHLRAYNGCLIVISHDRHFLNEICTHTADIDYQTVITYTGSYDDMVLAKTQVRARIEADNAQREKKIEQLQDFIARFSAGTRSSQVQSRKKEVERLQTAELARSNIQRPFIRFDA